jgi:hypothetical protein
MMMMLFGEASQDVPYPDQVVFQLAAKRADVLLFFEMREQPVEQEQLRAFAGNRAADAAEVVQLSECPSEGGLPALIGPRNHEYPLLSLELKVVTDDPGVLPEELMGQSQIEGSAERDSRAESALSIGGEWM